MTATSHSGGIDQLATADQDQLLRLARRAIDCALQHREFIPEPGAYAGPLAQRQATFVTLKKSGALRGCIGTLEARDPLAVAVIDCAVGAALRDPRFPTLAVEELLQVRISISVLGEPHPIPASDRAELLTRLQPGCDGLILECGRHRATFLPQVWEQLPEPAAFVSHLLQKAGLAANFWSDDIRVQRYGSFSFTEPDPHSPGI